jgi:hypothetical protein
VTVRTTIRLAGGTQAGRPSLELGLQVHRAHELARKHGRAWLLDDHQTGLELGPDGTLVDVIAADWTAEATDILDRLLTRKGNPA